MRGTRRASHASGDAEATAETALISDRRVEASEAQLADVERRLSETTALMNEVLDGIAAIRNSRGQIQDLLADYTDAEDSQTARSSAVARFTAWERDRIVRNRFVESLGT